MNLGRFIYLRLQGAFGQPIFNDIGKSDPPPQPDYAGAAKAQGSANVQSAIASAILSQPNQVTPYGSQTWNQIGSTNIPGADGNPALDIPRFQGTTSLTPLGQQRLDQENRIVNQLGGMAESGLGRVQNTMAQPFTFNGPNARQTIGANDFSADRSKVEEALLSRLEPRFQRDEEALRSRMLTQGHNPQGEASRAEFERFDQAKNDARMQAVMAGGQEQSRLFGLERDSANFQNSARDKAIQEAAYMRSIPLNEVNALRTGNQVQMPQFQQAPQANVQPAPMFGATQAAGQYAGDMYNAQQAQQGAMMGGLFGLGGSLAMAGGIPGIPGIGRR